MVEQHCDVYRRQFALEAFRDPIGGHIVAVTGPHTAGVIVPRLLAAAACHLLDMAPVPVFAVGGDLRVFLTEGVPDSSATLRLSWSLFRYPIVPTLTPTPLALPTPGSGLRSWLWPPEGPARPPIATVVAALQAATRLGS
ncbi:hypothetical protein ACIP5Y_12740 [Nocardia sp. NPDC088792]|uniref:hypothetical protein n=1 Tax=Nocardia sp. NPDC088792 TaxID=3364332 RepID=UPI0038210B99